MSSNFRTYLLWAGLASASAAYGQNGPYPIVDCVVAKPNTQLMVAYFGYVNNPSAQTIPAGGGNYLSGTWQTLFGAPPVNFPQGAAHIVFAVEYAAGTSLGWTVNGITATASTASSPVCEVAVGTSAVSGSMDKCWDTNQSQGHQNLCDPEEDIDGDGFCTVRDCVGPAGQPGVAGPAGASGQTGATGPAGIPPVFQTITASPGLANATAACGANQFLVTGGGTCTVPNQVNLGRVASSAATSGTAGWSVSCNAGQATAVAVCANNQ